MLHNHRLFLSAAFSVGISLCPLSYGHTADLSPIQAIPAATTASLLNGAPLHHAFDEALPRVSVVLMFKGGTSLLPMEKQGVFALNGLLFDQGPIGMTLEDYQHRLFMLQGSIDVSPQARAVSVTVTAPATTLRDTLKLAMDVLNAPKYTPEDFERARERSLSLQKTMVENLRMLMGYLGPRLAFQWHPETRDGTPSLASLQKVTLEDLQQTHAQLFDLRHAEALSTGAVAVDDLRSLLNDVVFASASSYEAVSWPTLDPSEFRTTTPRVYVVHKEGVPDNQISILFPQALPIDTPDRLNGLVALDILGGGMSGRLMKQLRTERGLTYGIGASLSSNLPLWGIRTFGTQDNVKELIVGAQKIIEDFRATGPTEAEWSESQKQIDASFRESLELPADRLAILVRQSLYQVDPAFYDNFLDSLRKTTPKTVKTFAETMLSTAGGVLVVIGPRDVWLKTLRELGFEDKQITVMNIDDIP